MKRATNQRMQLRARLERFEPRLCMTGDFLEPPGTIEIVDPIPEPAADFSDAPVDRDQETHDPHTLPDPETIPAAYRDADDPTQGEDEDGLRDGVGDSDPWFYRVPDVGIDGAIGDDDFFWSLPNDTDPDDNSRSNVDLDDDSLGGLEIPAEGGAIKPEPNPDPKPDAKPDAKPGANTNGKPSSAVQGAPVFEVKNLEGRPGAPAFLPSIPAGNQATWELAPVSAESSLEIRVASARSPSVSQMQRFSSTDGAFADVHDAVIEPRGLGNVVTVRPLASGNRSQSESPRYFVLRQEAETQLAKRRDSYSDQSILHEPEDAAGMFGPTREVAVALATHVFVAEMPQRPQETQPVEAEPSSQRPPVEPKLEAAKHRSLQHFLGMFMAGAVISLQEAGRILGKQNKEEKALHLMCLSTLRSSSNS